jgi:CHASE3 domain sensor protein
MVQLLDEASEVLAHVINNMGNIECCEAGDPQLRVTLQGTKGFMLDNPQGYQQLVTEFQMFKNKTKSFGDIFLKKNEGKNEFILQVFSSNRGSDVVNVPLRIYSDAVEHAEKKKMLTL